ncbi:hypothetical protein, partial [Salmonella enterica]|uniref:hypothetical protein n=1 Tax=Salmonella enterica TaxID=28901 RepID=UPI001CB8368A
VLINHNGLAEPGVLTPIKALTECIIKFTINGVFDFTANAIRPNADVTFIQTLVEAIESLVRQCQVIDVLGFKRQPIQLKNAHKCAIFGYECVAAHV